MRIEKGVVPFVGIPEEMGDGQLRDGSSLRVRR